MNNCVKRVETICLKCSRHKVMNATRVKGSRVYGGSRSVCCSSKTDCKYLLSANVSLSYCEKFLEHLVLGQT